MEVELERGVCEICGTKYCIFHTELYGQVDCCTESAGGGYYLEAS